jgi:hypothetical protein
MPPQLGRHVLSYSVVLAAEICASARASECVGTPGVAIDIPSHVGIGESWTTCMTAPIGSSVVLLVAGSAGPIASPYGTLCIGAPIFLANAFSMPSPGTLCFDHQVPCSPNLVGFTAYFQLVAVNPSNPAEGMVSNGASLTIIDNGACEPCQAESSNAAGFNGTSIAAGRSIWFNAVVKPTGITGTDSVMYFRDAAIHFSADGVDYDLPLPDSVIEYSTTAVSASISYDAATNRWITVVPANYTGNVFLNGFSFAVPVDFPGGIDDVTWTGSFSADKSGVSFKWKWAAAVYSQLSVDLGAIGVKPIDGSAANPYPNSHHAGSPENFLSFVIGGAMGGGGSNFTGSYSGTKTVSCP